MRRLAALVALLAFAPLVAVAATPTAATIEPGDRLTITVYGEPSLSQPQTVVEPDGTIELPLVGTVAVAGESIDAATSAISTAFRRYLRTPNVALTLLQAGQISVTVLGDVLHPGVYRLRPGAPISEAVAAAGGLDPADLTPTKARIVTPDGGARELPLSDALRDDASIALTDRTLVYLPGAQQFDVTVLGAVDTPGTISVNDGDRLSMAIAKAGARRFAHSDLSRIYVTRTEPDGRTASHLVDLYQAIDGNDERYDPKLRKGDVIYVPIARGSGNAGVAALYLAAQALAL